MIHSGIISQGAFQMTAGDDLVAEKMLGHAKRTLGIQPVVGVGPAYRQIIEPLPKCQRSPVLRKTDVTVMEP